MKSITDFDSRWEYGKSTSKYHFDKTVDEDDSPPFKHLGRFNGDWSQDLQIAEMTKSPNTFTNRLRDNQSQVPYTRKLDEADLKRMGLTPEHVLFQKSRAIGPTLKKMVQYFDLVSPKVSVHIQYPGEVFPFHVDNITSLRGNSIHSTLDDNPEQAARFTVMLADWEYGHMFAYGNTYWKQWKAGDFIYHSWQDVPHGTANAGHSPRPSLQITGWVTQRTLEILNGQFQEVTL